MRRSLHTQRVSSSPVSASNFGCLRRGVRFGRGEAILWSAWLLPLGLLRDSRIWSEASDDVLRDERGMRRCLDGEPQGCVCGGH
jgi:hypothetical protein